MFLSPPQPQAVYSLTAAVADDEQPELAYTPTSFYAIVDPTYEGGSLHISAGINVYTGSPVLLEIELVGAPEVLIRLQQPTATIVIPAWSTWGDVYIPTLDDNHYQGTLPVEVRVRLAAPSVSDVYTGFVNLGDDELPPSSATKVVEYTYDYRNRLIGREEDGEREAFVYDGEQVLLRFDDVGDLASRYLWGPGVDLLLTDEQLDTGDLLWAAGDHQNSVRDLVTFDPTTHTAQVAAHRVYTAYGSLASETRQAGDPAAAAVDTIFGYTGRYFDDATRLQNNLNRWYDPETKQWASEDPIGFAAGDPNPRRYVSNDPVNKVDPDGLEELPTGSLSRQQRKDRLKVIVNQRDDAELAQEIGTAEVARALFLPLHLPMPRLPNDNFIVDNLKNNFMVDNLSAYYAEPLIVGGLGAVRFLQKLASPESEGKRIKMTVSHAAGYIGESRWPELGEGLFRVWWPDYKHDYKYMTVMPKAPAEANQDEIRLLEVFSGQKLPTALQSGSKPVWFVDKAERYWQTKGDYESGAYGSQAAPFYDFVIEAAAERGVDKLAMAGPLGMPSRYGKSFAPTNRGLTFVGENLGTPRNAAMRTAKDFESGTIGAFSDVASQQRMVPALRFDNLNPNGASFVKFDGYQQLDNGITELIDSKTRLVPFSTRQGPFISDSVRDGLVRKSLAIQQNEGFRAVLEFPTATARREAQQVLRQLGITNISTRVRP